MKDVIAFLILLPFLCLMGKVIGKFYYRLGVGLCRMLRPSTRRVKSPMTAGNGGHSHAGGLQVRTGSDNRFGHYP
jgi:hypothetical protein